MGFSLVAGTVCVIFFLSGSVCVNFLSPEPDCAQIFSLHSFCMGFSLIAGTVCVIFFLRQVRSDRFVLIFFHLNLDRFVLIFFHLNLIVHKFSASIHFVWVFH